MTATREVTIWCNGRSVDNLACLVWERVPGPAVDARQTLRSRGWTYARIDGVLKDFCPVCSARRAEAIAKGQKPPIF